MNLTWTNERRKLGDLIEWDKNPRQINKDQARRLRQSLAEFGQVQAICIDPGNMIIDGHQRKSVWGLADEFGMDYIVDVRVASRKLTDKEQQKLTIFLGKGAAGEWDFDALANFFQVDDLIEWGFEERELDLDLWPSDEPPEDPGAELDRAEELREKWGVSAGQLWQLGEHRLICGDCTDAATLEKLIDEERYSVLTDPPYNIGFNYESIDDEMSETDYQNFCDKWFSVIESAECIIFTPGPKNERIYPPPRDRGYWLKRYASAGASAFHLRCVEPILIYGKIANKRTFDYFDFSSGFPEELRAARCAARVEDKHPPAKPALLWEELLGMLDEAIPVVDLFLGNGTTLIACERLGRKCRAVEISPAYCGVTLERWSVMTGQQPVLLDS